MNREKIRKLAIKLIATVPALLVTTILIPIMLISIWAWSFKVCKEFITYLVTGKPHEDVYRPKWRSNKTKKM
jgi:hypothetical protein